MRTWKVMLGLAAVALPLGLVVAQVTSGAEEPAPRAPIVLPAAGSEKERNDRIRRPGPNSSPGPTAEPSAAEPPPPSPTPAPPPPDEDDGDDDDDGPEVIRPDPEDFGDDDDDDDGGERGDD